MVDTKPHIEEYKGYLILDLNNGISSLQDYCDLKGEVLLYSVEKNEVKAHFAFANLLHDLSDNKSELNFLNNNALQIIKEAIDKNNIENFQELTFEFKNKIFSKVVNPEWWKQTRLYFRF